MLAPLLMVPAPCPLHLRPGGGARPALRPGELPPPRAGPTATRRCGRRQRGRGAAGVAAEEKPARSPARPPAAHRAGAPEAPAVPWGFPAPAVCRRSGAGSAATSPQSPSVRPSVHRSVRSLAPGRASPEHAPSAERRVACTHALPPAADRLLRSRDPAQPGHAPWPRPTCSAPPLAAPRGVPPLFPARDDAGRSDSMP